VSSQPEVAKLAPELVDGVTTLARTLVAAVRHWTLYPENHPAVRASFERLAGAIHGATNDSVFSLGITPDSLLIEAFPVPPTAQVVEAARLLHDRDLLRLTFSGRVPPEAIARLLRLLALDRETLRQRGGPEGVWREEGDGSITVEQIDYAQVLEDKEQHVERRHDDIWRSIVHSIVAGQKALDEIAQQRLLAIAADPDQIGDLATAVIAHKCTPDGAPMITTQAATVLAAFRHLASIVSVKAADRSDETMRNLATAASTLNPHVVMEMLQSEDSPGDTIRIAHGLSAAFDDMKVAQLLATALSNEGQASGRLAEVFNTIAPDPERKKRVLTMTRSLLSESAFGQTKQFKAIWSSMEELLISYNDTPFVSQQYRTQLDSATARGETIGVKDLPPEELARWTESLGQENVRKLSVVLIIDLLTLEREAARAAEIADDMTALAEDLLMAGDYDDARRVAAALAGAAGNRKFVAPGACREALHRLAVSAAVHEVAAMLGDLDPESATVFAEICRLVGVPVVDVLAMTLRIQERSAARVRASDIIVGFGAPAVSRLAAFVDDERAYVQCHAAELLGRIASPDAVPLLQPMLRRNDPKVVRAAVVAMANIDDPAAARAIHTVLRAVTGEQRRAVIDALVGERDARVVPMLVRILEESDPLGKDHAVVLDTLAALKIVHTNTAIRPIVTVARRKRWFARARNKALKTTAIETLASIGTEESRRALTQAAAEGDRLLRKLARAKLAESGQS
jgi:HEAT repeat protein